MRLTLSLALGLLLFATPLAAQDDAAAGLFTTARDLPLVSQSLVVRVTGADAVLELTQVFANDGDAVGQADFRLPLPDGAVVTGYGFWQGGTFLAAELKEKAEAVAAHREAAAEGRSTALSKNEGGRVQTFSVYPVLAGELVQVEVTMRLPVATEEGRSHLRLPIERFLGRSPVSSPVVVHLETAEPLADLGVDEVPFRLTKRAARTAKLALAADRGVELWWAEETPPLLARAEAVPLDDGSLAWGLRLAFRDEPRAAGGSGIRETVLLVDVSSSVRRRGVGLTDAVLRILARVTTPVRVLTVGGTSRELDGDATAIVAALGAEDAFAVSFDDLVAAAAAAGCGEAERRCVAVTDPQVAGLAAKRSPPFETLFLADADERIAFGAVLGPEALVWDPAVEARGKLHALVDELVRPVLEVRSLEQRGGTLEVLPGQRLRVASGGQLRVYGLTHSDAPLDLGLVVGGEERTLRVELAALAPDEPRAVALRREAYRLRLEEWMAAFRTSPDPELRARIVELSVREGIPTPVTAFQVDAAGTILPKTATPAPLLRLVGLVLLAAAGAAALAGRRG